MVGIQHSCTSLGTPLPYHPGLQYTSRVHREEPAQALERRVVEQTVSDERVTVVTHRHWSHRPTPVSLLGEKRRRGGPGLEERGSEG